MAHDTEIPVLLAFLKACVCFSLADPLVLFLNLTSLTNGIMFSVHFLLLGIAKDSYELLHPPPFLSADVRTFLFSLLLFLF